MFKAMFPKGYGECGAGRMKGAKKECIQMPRDLHFRLLLIDVPFLNLTVVMIFVFQPAKSSSMLEISSAVFMAAFPVPVGATE